MAVAVVQHGYGGVDVLKLEPVELAAPAPDEVRIRHRAIGLNFHDIYVREGTTRTLPLPGIPGIEAVGEIIAVGKAVRNWEIGTRVAYISRRYGAYSSERNISQDLLMRPPAGLGDDIIACSLVRGMTAAVLLTKLRAVGPGQSVLVHAASGSLGRLLCDWAKQLGARVAGTVRSAERVGAAPRSCDQVFVLSDPDWAERVYAYFGTGADYVLDSIGAPTFMRSLDATAVCGHVCLVGQAGGSIENIPVSALARKSMTFTRPIVFDWYRSGAVAEALVSGFFALVERQVLEVRPPMVLPLEEVAKAQALLQQRSLDSPIVLRP